jgi:hypothetical protein
VDCEVLLPKIAKRGQRMMQAMVETAASEGIKVKVTEEYQGCAPWLMSWGLGHLGRRPSTDAHMANGGRLIGWDIGYFAREESLRLTIDADHPQKYLRDNGSERWDALGIRLRNDYLPDGPVILVGLGPKSRMQFGFQGLAWEIRKLGEIRKAFPRRNILFRPKKEERMQGVRSISGPIEQAIRGASLVVCKHSNVAIDACIAGIPVACEDGAAAAIYNNNLASPEVPDLETRQAFLEQLAWFNWHPNEAANAWKFLKKVLS